jgi:hypothetical protein
MSIKPRYFSASKNNFLIPRQRLPESLPKFAFGLNDLYLLHSPTAQANFFFNCQKATQETKTIPQAKPINIKPKNRVFLNV